ncbi:serine/threonine-protein kinase VRK1-like [Cylas formicarius]|uniref:serine/threonine-protein kinase VRK1-like n=1 Tax=Cylas formicarius TaxID=197179 RepID=UPI0029589521|nr:serine/threonine-protein kinase VRK1-like [Cylas formicarius]
MPPKKKPANGYKFAESLPKGTVLTDIAKKQWSLGPSIGKGGFGEIYSAQASDSSNNKYPFVLKIEPHSNGPLFVEINFYIRHAKAADIEEFQKQRGLKSLGMPVYHGSGSHEYNNEKYRFLVMDMFGTDLHKLYLKNNKMFPTETVFQLAIQILDVLEYIHSRGYVHADIKAANILLSETQSKQVYLVDFGLSTKYTLEKDFKPNPKKAHDGTIEYLSRDAHNGVQTRRGDLEILGYNLIHWLGCALPWEDNLGDPKEVQKSKEEHMQDVSKLLKACFKAATPPKALVDFLNYLTTMKFDTEPDYKEIRKKFISGVKDAGGAVGGSLKFSKSRGQLKRKSASLNNISGKKSKESSQEQTVKVKASVRRKKAEKVAGEHEEVVNGYSDTDIPVAIPVRKRNPAKKTEKKEKKALEAKGDDLEGYTDAMKEVLKKMQDGPKSKTKKTSKQPPLRVADDLNTDGYTDEMKEIAFKKKARDKPSPIAVAGTSKMGLVSQSANPNARKLRERAPVNYKLD